MQPRQAAAVEKRSMQSDSEIIVIGGGVIGLATAIELRLLGAAVTILSKDFKAAAGHAAAGMLAPQAERIAPGAMWDLCLASRDLYPEWIAKIEAISGIDAGYWQCGILAPYYTELEPSPDWMDARSIRHHQADLGEAVVGGYHYPAEGQVDNRALMRSLLIASQSLGVKFGDGIEIVNIHQHHGRVTHLETNKGDIRAHHYILTTGAWSQQLLAIPVVPRKGQMLSVLVPIEQRDRLPLQQVLFGEEIYIGFAPSNTLKGVKQLMTDAMRLFPPLQQFPLLETWWGYRPATPDELPILGASAAKNFTMATGHYRNGILLTPITAKLIADLVWYQRTDNLLAAFSWQRFDFG
jgi:glycine/D-amino acid oxidase-like deaminating enzyme